MEICMLTRAIGQGFGIPLYMRLMRTDDGFVEV